MSHRLRRAARSLLLVALLALAACATQNVSRKRMPIAVVKVGHVMPGVAAAAEQKGYEVERSANAQQPLTIKLPDGAVISYQIVDNRLDRVVQVPADVSPDDAPRRLAEAERLADELWQLASAK